MISYYKKAKKLNELQQNTPHEVVEALVLRGNDNW